MALDNETRARLVREWMRSPLKQTAFCAAHGISTRALRGWMRRFGSAGRPEARALAIIDDAIEQLRELRASLVAEQACPAGTDEGARDEGGERHADSEPRPPAAVAAAVAGDPARPRPMPPPSFPWHLC